MATLAPLARPAGAVPRLGLPKLRCGLGAGFGGEPVLPTLRCGPGAGFGGEPVLLRLRCRLATPCAAAALPSAGVGLPMPAGRGMRLPAIKLARDSVIDPPLRCAALAEPLRCAALAEALRAARPVAPGEEAALEGLGCVDERALPEGLRATCSRAGRCGDSGSSFLGGGLDSRATLQVGGMGWRGS